MKVECWFTGKTRESYVREGMELYRRRIQPFFPLIVKELPDAGSGKDAPEKEAAAVLKSLGPNDILVLLDEKGRLFDSREFAGYVERLQGQSIQKLVFLAGGAYGFDQTVRARSKESISLSPMTFNHQLVRVIFLEQLYRAATILGGHPYHHD